MNDLSHALPASAALRLNRCEPAGTTKTQIVADQEIPAFRLFTGRAESQVIVSVPHGGWLYPQSLVSADNLAHCASLADTGTAELGLMLADGPYPVLIASCCRAVCDLNRPAAALDPQLCTQADGTVPEAYRPYVAAGYGVVPRLSAQKQPLHSQMLARPRWQAILAAWHSPYHRQLADMLQTASRLHKEVVLVDLHSMPDSPKQNRRQQGFAPGSGHLPDFVFGNLHGATLSQDKAEAIDEVMRHSGCSWRWNSPYAGGYITRHYGLAKEQPAPVQVLQIEVNRGLYSTPAGTLDPSRLNPVCQIVDRLLGALITG